MTWVWRLELPDGTPVTTVPSPTHGSRSDAESWLGETWRELAEQGIAQVTLLSNGEPVYGPMSLSDT